MVGWSGQDPPQTCQPSRRWLRGSPLLPLGAPELAFTAPAGSRGTPVARASAHGWTLSGGVCGDDGGRSAALAARSPSVITASRRPARILLLLIKPDVEMEMKT